MSGPKRQCREFLKNDELRDFRGLTLNCPTYLNFFKHLWLVFFLKLIFNTDKWFRQLIQFWDHVFPSHLGCDVLERSGADTEILFAQQFQGHGWEKGGSRCFKGGLPHSVVAIGIFLALESPHWYPYSGNRGRQCPGPQRD